MLFFAFRRGCWAHIVVSVYFAYLRFVWGHSSTPIHPFFLQKLRVGKGGTRECATPSPRRWLLQLSE
jgi:hypothetical protein